ncbi:MAG: M15 family metallopeptidase [Patescibacteria group bacterium]|jgi:hypothetical protein
MFILKDKTNWLYLTIVIILATFSIGGILFFRHQLLVEDVIAMESFNILRPAPLPTEINQNFLTQVNDCFIPVAALYGYTLRISSGFRTIAEQDEIYNQGRTVNGHLVTDAQGGKSIHNYGYAVDIVDRWNEYNIDWKKLAKITTFCRLEPSEEGDISHVEYRGGISTRDFMYGSRPEPLTLPCEIMKERSELKEKLTLKDLKNCGAPNFSN